MKLKKFIYSVQGEFWEERHGLKEWLTPDPFMSRFVENVFLFEDFPLPGKNPEDTYLNEVHDLNFFAMSFLEMRWSISLLMRFFIEIGGKTHQLMLDCLSIICKYGLQKG